MKNEICVPADALQSAGEGGEGIAPEAGDAVDFTGRGKVTRIEGGNAYIEALEINGKPVMGEGLGGETMPATPEVNDADELGALRQSVKGMAWLLFLCLCLWTMPARGQAQQFELRQWSMITVTATTANVWYQITTNLQPGGPIRCSVAFLYNYPSNSVDNIRVGPGTNKAWYVLTNGTGWQLPTAPATKFDLTNWWFTSATATQVVSVLYLRVP